MGDGKHCPGCGKDIGAWPIFSATLPNRIRCPHCKSRLRYRRIAGVITIVLLGLCGLMVITFIRVSALTTPRRGLIGASVVLVFCILAELATIWFLRNRRELELADRPRPEFSGETSGSGDDQPR